MGIVRARDDSCNNASIGLSTPMLSAGLAELFGFERGFRLDVAVILIWSAIVGFSVYAGLAKGIRVLSDINLGLGAIVLAVVLLCGPTGFIIDTFTNSMGLLVQNFIRMSFYLDPVAKADGFIAALSEGASYVNATVLAVTARPKRSRRSRAAYGRAMRRTPPATVPTRSSTRAACVAPRRHTMPSLPAAVKREVGAGGVLQSANLASTQDTETGA